MSRHEQGVSLCRGVLRWCVAVCAAVHAGAVARRAGSGLLKPAEWLAWMRVLKPFLHVSACPDVLLCTDCVLVGCATVIGWSVGVVWVSRHEQNVSLWPGCSPLVCGCLCRCACRGCGDTGGQGLAEMGWRLHEDDSAAWILTVICAFDGRVVACI